MAGLLAASLLLLPSSQSFRTVKLGGKDCDFKGERICNGAVTKEVGEGQGPGIRLNVQVGTRMLQLCVDGKVKLKKRAEVGEGFPLVGRDTGPGKGEGNT